MMRLHWLFPLALLPACAQPEAPPQQRVPVTVGAVERRDVPFELAATGTVEPLQTVAVQPQIGGPIVRVAFREGQDVEKGQILFQIDPRPYQAALAQAEALLARDRAQSANAEQEAKRYAELAQREYVTAQQYDQARTVSAAAAATLAGSEAEVDEARLNLQYATIRAPIARADRQPAGARGESRARRRCGPAGHHQPDPPDPGAFRRAGRAAAADPAPPERAAGGARGAGGWGRRERGRARVRGQRGGHHHRHHPAEGQLRQYRRRALARRVRQRPAAALHRRQTRWWCPPRPW